MNVVHCFIQALAESQQSHPRVFIKFS